MKVEIQGKSVDDWFKDLEKIPKWKKTLWSIEGFFQRIYDWFRYDLPYGIHNIFITKSIEIIEKDDMDFSSKINHYLNNFNVINIDYEVRLESWKAIIFYKEKVVKKVKKKFSIF